MNLADAKATLYLVIGDAAITATGGQLPPWLDLHDLQKTILDAISAPSVRFALTTYVDSLEEPND